jgi:hypothetical protein
LISVMSSVLGAIIVAVALPTIDTFGAAVMYLLCAILMWISYGYVVVRDKEIDLLIMTSDSGL